MHSKKIILSIAALFASLISANPLQAAEAVLASDGSLSLGNPELRLAPIIHAFNWDTRTANPHSIGKTIDGFAIQIDEDNTLYGHLVARESENGGVHADYTFKSEASCPVDAVCLAADLPASEIGGGTWTADSQSGTVPVAMLEKVHLFTGNVSRFTLKGPAGKPFFLELTFATPTSVLLQDSRKWGGSSFTLRLSPAYDGRLSKGQTFSLSFTAKGPEPLKIVDDKPVTISTLGGDWIPVKQELEIKPGSALDFSELVPWHKPAGKFGRVIAKGSHFEFEKMPDVSQRFYGVNLCFTANYLSADETSRLASRFRRIGYNTVRIHHFDNALVEGTPDKTTQFNPQSIDQLDQLIAAFVTNGIYVTTDLVVSRSVPWRSIGIDRDGSVPMDEFKLRCAIDPAAMKNWKDFTRLLLTHVNPYTGRRYADEPALAWISLVNEGNLGNYLSAQREIPAYTTRWKEWLTKRRATDPHYLSIPETIPSSLYDITPHSSAYSQFLSELEANMAREMKTFVQNDLHCRALITNGNGWTQKVTDQITRDEVYDYVDDHFYIDHPQFLQKPWSLPSRCPNTNPFKGASQGMIASAFSRIADKPFTVSEYNFSGPGRYRGVGGLSTGAIAALQDWSVLWRFAFSHNRNNLFEAAPIGYFDIGTDPLMLASERASLCLFLRGDVAPLQKTLTLVIPRDAGSVLYSNGVPNVCPSWLETAWSTKVQTTVGREPASSTWRLPFPLAYTPEGASQARNFVAREPFGGGGIRVDDSRGTFIMDTPRTAGGFTEGGIVDAGFLKFDVQDVPATLWVSSLDGKPGRISSRLLLTHLTDVQNTGTSYGEKARRTLLAWGQLPHLAQRGHALVALALDKPEQITVYSLSASGERLTKIKTSVKNGALCFTADTGLNPNAATLLYELVRE